MGMCGCPRHIVAIARQEDTCVYVAEIDSGGSQRSSLQEDATRELLVAWLDADCPVAFSLRLLSARSLESDPVRPTQLVVTSRVVVANMWGSSANRHGSAALTMKPRITQF